MSRTSKDGFPIRKIGLHNITVDFELQSRVITDVGTQMEYSEDMLRGDVFPPLTVFDDGEKLWLAAGFTRHGAALKAGFTDFECEIRPGKRRDAIVFSTASNKEHGKRPTAEDLRKACEMLFADPEWSQKAGGVIAKHIGVSVTTVKKYRVNYHEKTGTPIPMAVEKANGTRQVISYDKNRVCTKTRNDGTVYYEKKINGKKIYLGTNRNDAEKQLQSLVDQKSDRRLFFSSTKLSAFLSNYGIAARSLGFTGSSIPGLFGVIARSHFLTWSPLENPIDATHAVARAILGSIHAGTTGRKVVLCDPENAPPAIIDLARQAGVEFITPEDFVASLQGEQGSQLRAAQ